MLYNNIICQREKNGKPRAIKRVCMYIVTLRLLPAWVHVNFATPRTFTLYYLYNNDILKLSQSSFRPIYRFQSHDNYIYNNNNNNDIIIIIIIMYNYNSSIDLVVVRSTVVEFVYYRKIIYNIASSPAYNSRASYAFIFKNIIFRTSLFLVVIEFLHMIIYTVLIKKMFKKIQLLFSVILLYINIT
ncbi:hypothetical protein AGLY_004951 [Aphis glycines]|uniref:Uncharacterized protein n=1 Tax=Aphis glycines TaxID=307491 RepID=A0A6G0TXN1_APHGL|nr:hypothetical protein AGLY_004951 [Aphis glycines]